MSASCSVCERGREACQYCENATEGAWLAMCDCGLHDFGSHLTDCESQKKYRYVIACDYDSAVLPRQDSPPRSYRGCETGVGDGLQGNTGAAVATTSEAERDA